MVSSICLASQAKLIRFILVLVLIFIPVDRVAHGFTQCSIVPLTAPKQDRGFFPGRVLRRISGDDIHEGCEGGKDDEGLSRNITANESSNEISHVMHPLLPKPLPKHIWNSFDEKQRREEERLLLAKVLEEGDEALQELRDFWGSQCDDSQQTELMYEAARGIGDPRQWNSSTQIFETLCKENPTFLEPFARLSKLYCLMGRIEESQAMALAVLNRKPWHVLAIETMVATSYALGNVESSVHWASQRLPPPSQTKKRNEWIHRAIQASLELENIGAGGETEDSVGEDIPTVEKDAWQ